MRLKNYSNNDQTPVVIHLGDHDPSGIDMSRDIDDRFKMFCDGDRTIDVQRIALNMNQVEAQKPPPNPCKITDSRADGYIRTYGDESWELDALQPEMIADLIRNKVYEYRDAERWEEGVEREETESKKILAVSMNWAKIVKAGLDKAPK